MLKGKTALVTGSTSGIGLGIAKALARQGANIVLNGFGDNQGPRAEIAALGVKVGFHGADMSKPSEIEAMMAYAAADFGRVDILVNNAGIQHVARIEDFPVERWDAIIAINLSSAFHATRLALPAMRRPIGAASSTWPRCTASWPRPRSPPTWPPSTALSD
jgi:3-hydroxybutyrate dehydrogenase